MKLQNLAIIFIVIFIPLLLVLSYYLDQQRDTLALQAEYDLKLSEATKEGIKAFEINTVDWSSTKQDYARNNAKATINTFITSLANNLNISGTAREYMLDYIPAVALTMYDGYYVYAPAYTPVTIKNENGVQLFLNGNKITTDSEGTIIYEPESGNVEGTIGGIEYTTKVNDAKKEYKHTLNNKTAYTEEYIKGSNTYIVNYTLDNKISVYKIDSTEKTEQKIEQKTGYLVYFDEKTSLPKIEINGETVSAINKVSDTKYSKSNTETTNIEPETLTEQILYKDSEAGAPQLRTFSYVYTTTSEKLYYDGSNFFKLKDNVKENISDSDSIKVGDDGCYYKSLSLLIGGEKTTEFKKIYQVLNGRDKGKWYIDLKDTVNELDTEIENENLSALGINGIATYEDCSAINYYVEAYAFTNWVKGELGTGDLKQKKLEYELSNVTNKFEPKYKEVSCANIFNISEANNPEDETSMFVEHKKEVMKDSINTNLNSAISSYNRNGNYDFKLPILTDGDWEQIFSNISLITFFQGVPIGLKYYNNYAIATSTTNREYVAPNEIFFTGESDDKYHQVYCDNCLNEWYTGYRSTEYTLREYTYKEKAEDGTETTETKYYYQHDNNTNSSAEIGCYYCIINKANYKQISSEKADYETIAYRQTKSYNEALARERYYQNEKVTANVGINLIYDANLKVNVNEGGFITNVKDVDPKEILIEPNQQVKITDQEPVVTTNNGIRYVLEGWALTPDAKNAEYTKNYLIYNVDLLDSDGDGDVTLYAVWSMELNSLEWNEDFLWSLGEDNDAPYPAGDGNISVIRFNENNVEMYGNGEYPGKGAAWLKWEYLNMDIVEMSFKYDIDFGDSFNAAGVIFDLDESDPSKLTGYMLSFNYSGSYGALSGEAIKFREAAKDGYNAVLWKFTYNKGKNNDNMEELTPIKKFSSIPQSGEISISISNDSYEINVNNGAIKETIDSQAANNSSINVNKNAIGFFSDHYPHSCDNCGYFKIDNISLIAKQKN